VAKSWDMTSGGKLLPPVEIEVEVLLEEEVFEEEASDDLPKKDNDNLQQNSICIQKKIYKRKYVFLFAIQAENFRGNINRAIILPLVCF
jgi:hypothetical protein